MIESTCSTANQGDRELPPRKKKVATVTITKEASARMRRRVVYCMLWRRVGKRRKQYRFEHTHHRDPSFLLPVRSSKEDLCTPLGNL